MGIYDDLASQELMEKLAALEPDEAPKTAAATPPSSSSSRMRKLASTLELARQAGAARADEEWAALQRR